MDISEIKKLLVSARNGLHNELHLKRTKQIKYDEKKYFELLSFGSLLNAAGEDSSKVMNEIDDVPSGDALMQQLQKFNLEEVEEMYNNIYGKQFRKQFRKKKKAIAIIDLHEQETYAKDKRTSDDIRGGKHKNGTNFFFKFATIMIVIGDQILTLAVRLHRRQETLKSIVDALIKRAEEFVKIKVLLLDRGFRNVEIINELEYLNIPMIMPCFKDEKARKLFEKTLWKFSVVKYSWRNEKGEYADFKLLIIKLSNNEEIGFYTTIRFARLHRAKYFLDLYAKRWKIETGYRLQNQFLPKTTCVKGVVRYFYFCYAVALHNLWLTLRSVVGKKLFTVTRMKFILLYFWITTHLNPEW